MDCLAWSGDGTNQHCNRRLGGNLQEEFLPQEVAVAWAELTDNNNYLLSVWTLDLTIVRLSASYSEF